MSQDERDYWYDPKRFRNINYETHLGQQQINNSHRAKSFLPLIAGLFSAIAISLWISRGGLEKIQSSAAPKIIQVQDENYVRQQQQAVEKKPQPMVENLPIFQAKTTPEIIISSQPKNQKILVKAKSSNQCRNSEHTITNESILCMKDHYE